MSEPAHTLIALDIDGTVVREDDSLSPRVAAAVRTVVERGYTVVLATGRSESTTRVIGDRIGFTPPWMVSANGALVLRLDGDDYKQVHVETFDPAPVLERIVQGLPNSHYMVEDATGRRLYTAGLQDWNLQSADEVPFERLTQQPAIRVVVQSPDHAVDDFLGIVESMGLHKVTYSIGYSSWLDIAPEGVNKSTGLARVVEATGIQRANVIAVGDGRNDIDMFEWVVAGGGRAVAMGQAPEVVQQAASEVTASVDDDGLAVVLEDLLAR